MWLNFWINTPKTQAVTVLRIASNPILDADPYASGDSNTTLSQYFNNSGEFDLLTHNPSPGLSTRSAADVSLQRFVDNNGNILFKPVIPMLTADVSFSHTSAGSNPDHEKWPHTLREDLESLQNIVKCTRVDLP